MLSVLRSRIARAISAACIPAALLLAAMLLPVPSAMAQSSDTAGLEVTVHDPSGAVLPGAKLHLVQQQQNITRDAVSDKSGHYRFAAIPSGDYVLTVAKEGFGEVVESGISLTVGQSASVNVPMHAKSDTQVNVTTETPIIDSDRSSIGQTISTEDIENLPSDSRNFLDFALTVPGIDANSGGGQGSGISVNGGRQRSNSILVDGVENNGILNGTVRQTISIDAVKEFQVITNNFLPEYGQASGAVINLITKTGAERTHGDVYYYVRNPSLNALGHCNSLGQNCTGKDLRRNDFGATLGGPLYKDKTFYFASGEYLGTGQTQLSTVGDVTHVNSALASGFVVGSGVSSVSANGVYQSYPLTLGSFRVDHTMNERNTFIFRTLYAHYNNANPTIDRSYSRSDYSNWGKDVLQAYSMMGAWTHIISPSLLNEMHVQFAPQHLTQYANSTGVTIHIVGNIEFGPNPIYPSALDETHYEWIDALSWTHGHHYVKTGADISVIRAHATLPTDFGGFFHFASLGSAQIWAGMGSCGADPSSSTFGCGFPDQFIQGFGNPEVFMTDKLFAGYIEDQWKALPRLSINYGVRYDVDLQPGYNQDLSDPIQAPLPKAIPRDFNNFAPRIGFALSLDKSGNTVLRGGYGIFYDRIFLILSRDALLSRAELDENLPSSCGAQMKAQFAAGPYPSAYNFPASYNFDPASFATHCAPGPLKTSIDSIDPKVPMPSTHQANLFLDRSLGRQWQVEVGGTFIAGMHLVRASNSNLLPPVILTPSNQTSFGYVPFSATGLAPTGGQSYGRPFYGGARRNSSFNNITSYGSHGHSTYSALRASVVHRVSHSLTLRASYIWSKTIDDSSDFTASSEPTNAYIPQKEKALSVQDRRHHFIGSFVYHFPYAVHRRRNSPLRLAFGGWIASGFLNMGSGQPENPETEVDSNGDGEINDRPFLDLVGQPVGALGSVIAGRNSMRDPRTETLQLRLQKQFYIARNRFTISAEAFNALNHTNVTDLDNDWGSGNSPRAAYATPDAYGNPRSIQLGVKYQF